MVNDTLGLLLDKLLVISDLSWEGREGGRVWTLVPVTSYVFVTFWTVRWIVKFERCFFSFLFFLIQDQGSIRRDRESQFFKINRSLDG